MTLKTHTDRQPDILTYYLFRFILQIIIMEGNENLVLKQEQKFDTSIVKIEPDLTIQFEERICVKKEPFELRPAAEHHNGKDNMTFRVPSGITLEPQSSIRRPEIIERPSLPPTPVLLNTPHKKYRRIVSQNMAIDFTATGNQGATNSTSPTPPPFQVNSDDFDHRSRDSSPDNLVIAETSSTTSSTELDSTTFKPPCPDRLIVSLIIVIICKISIAPICYNLFRVDI